MMNRRSLLKQLSAFTLFGWLAKGAKPKALSVSPDPRIEMSIRPPYTFRDRHGIFIEIVAKRPVGAGDLVAINDDGRISKYVSGNRPVFGTVTGYDMNLGTAWVRMADSQEGWFA
jgi:hypothetical protein